MIFPNIDPIALQLGPLTIRWYALSYVAGIILGYYYIGWLNRRFPYFDEKAKDDLIFYAVLGVILGGRIGYILFYNFPYYIDNPAHILRVWEGGMSFHGGLCGVLIAFVFFCRKHKRKWLAVMDYLAAATPIGLCLGRIANFINGELYGRVTTSAAGMIFPHSDGMPRHPSQLYEAGLEGALLFAILLIVVSRTQALKYTGLIGGLFLAGYGIARFIVEFFREPDAQLGFILGPFSMGQLLCTPMIAFGIWLAVTARKRA